MPRDSTHPHTEAVKFCCQHLFPVTSLFFLPQIKYHLNLHSHIPHVIHPHLPPQKNLHLQPPVPAASKQPSRSTSRAHPCSKPSALFVSSKDFFVPSSSPQNPPALFCGVKQQQKPLTAQPSSPLAHFDGSNGYGTTYHKPITQHQHSTRTSVHIPNPIRCHLAYIDAT